MASQSPSKPAVPMTPEALGRTKDGKFHIYQPEIVNGKMDFGSYDCATLRLLCQSAYMNKDGEISVCHNPFFTVVGQGLGDQTQIVECGKCRTQYIIRRKYNEQGNLTFSTSVWAIGRKVETKGKLWTDRKDWSSHVIFGTEKK